MAEGIDIYVKYQQVTDWDKVKAAGISYAYHKLSDGLTTRDANDVGAGSAAGIAQGGYHFSQPGDPVEQADVLIGQCIKWKAFGLNPALDLEDNPVGSGKPNIPDAQKADWAISFGRRILNRGQGFTLYANNSDMQLVQAKVRAALPQTHFWVARYGAKPSINYDSWQYTSAGTVPGIRGTVDRNTGSIPFNWRTIMALSDDDKKWLSDTMRAIVNDEVSNKPGWWYNPRFEKAMNFAQVFFGMRDKVNEIANNQPVIPTEIEFRQMINEAVKANLKVLIEGQVNITAAS
jgi:GH25 family lysozyme M1 (1,4-beta-N-acetylmuramidase)